MLDLLVPSCSRCGAWPRGGAVCPACGEARGELVGLDRAQATPPWIRVAHGAPSVVVAALTREALPPGADPARLATAQALVQQVAGPVAVQLDLRDPRVAGKVVRRSRRGPRQHRLVEQPWLVIRAPGVLVQAVRVEHQRLERSFATGAVQEASEAFGLDELRGVTGAGGLRAAARSPEALARVALSEADPGAPPPTAELPATAPGGVTAPGSLLPGLVATAVLLALPGWLSWAAAAVDGPSPAARADARREAVSQDPALRREGLVAADALPLAERLRLLRRGAQDSDPAVRDVALDRLAAQGVAGLATVAGLHGRPDVPPELRLQARRLLVQRDPGWAVELALEGLAAGGEPTERVRLAWVLTLGEAGSQRDPRVVAALRGCLQDTDPRVRGQAAWALADRSPPRLDPAGAAAALERGLADLARGAAAADRALLVLGRALARVDGGPALLRRAIATGELPERLARRLRALASGD